MSCGNCKSPLRETLGLALIVRLSQAFAEPLRASNPPIIPRSRLPAFLSEVLLNIDQIRAHSGSFLAALRLLQGRDADADAVGDLVERAALEWGPAYHEYITRLPLADQRLRQEKTENPAFRDFLEVRTYAGHRALTGS